MIASAREKKEKMNKMVPLEIKGQVNTAICYATVIEEEAIAQIRRMCDYPLTAGSTIRIMPDVHAGTGCTIGTTMTVTDKICPNIVGVDIGCGMYVVKLKNCVPDYEKIDEACHFIPSGFHVWEQKLESFPLSELRCYGGLRNLERLECSLGTLGGGNHFIEIDTGSDGSVYLVIHSGSRNLGNQVAGYYQQRAIDAHSPKAQLEQETRALIERYKAVGKEKAISSALTELRRQFAAQTATVPSELCWLSGADLEDYFHDIELCQAFARRSRELMGKIILERTGMEIEESFHTIHNYIDTQEMILRKGAIAAHAGEKVLIPLNMRDGSVLAVGKGNPDWNFSAPHGAGRIMSRSKARQALLLKDFEASMEGIYTTTVCEDTIDEAPMVYKAMKDIVDVVQDTVEILEVIKPTYNFKASGSEDA